MSKAIEVQGLNKTYMQGSSEIPVLKELHLEVAKGETIAILGKSGSGKSTLLSLLAGLDISNKGSITIGGTNITNLDEANLAEFRGKNIGIVFQQFHLMQNLSAFENICLPLDIHDNKDYSFAEKLLVQIGLGHRKSHFPGELSGGEKQRVAIARALVSMPEILFADEPSGNLDSETGETITELLFNLVETHQMTLILVTHDEMLAKRCDKIYRLKNGQLHLERS